MGIDVDEEDDGLYPPLRLEFKDSILDEMNSLIVHLNDERRVVLESTTWKDEMKKLASSELLLNNNIVSSEASTPRSHSVTPFTSRTESGVESGSSNSESVQSGCSPDFNHKIDLVVLEDMHQYATRLLTGINIYSICTILAQFEQVHTIYALTAIFHRFCAVLKCLDRFSEAIVVAQAAVHLYEMVAMHFDDHNMGLASCTSLLASLLVQTGAIDQAVELDKRAVDLSSKIPLFSV